MGRRGKLQLQTSARVSIEVAATSGEVKRSSVSRAARTTHPGTDWKLVRGWASFPRLRCTDAACQRSVKFKTDKAKANAILESRVRNKATTCALMCLCVCIQASLDLLRLGHCTSFPMRQSSCLVVAEPHAQPVVYMTQQPAPYICFSTALLI